MNTSKHFSGSHSHLNKAINYITQHMMEAPDLDKLASISGYSKFHFHRMFKAFTGESVATFTRRLRLEHGAFLLIFYKHKSIRDVALSCGFSSSQSFATAFKNYFKLSPKEYKSYLGCQGVKVSDPQSVANYEVRIQYVDAFSVVYERSFGTNDDFNLDAKRDAVLEKYPDKTCVSIAWDNPEMTPLHQCRFDYGYMIENEDASTLQTKQTIEAKTYAVITTALKGCKVIEVWNYLYASWLPRHGYKPDAVFCFEKIKKCAADEVQMIEFYLPIKKI